MNLYAPMPPGQYDVIVVDPPWPMKKSLRRVRPAQRDMDYKTLTIEQITSLSVRLLASEQAWVFLWTTQKHLHNAFHVMQDWGIRPLLTMTWEKTGRKGMTLFGFSWNAEFILVGRKNTAPTFPGGPAIPAVFQAPNVRHSQKPDKFYELVAPLGERRIDLFARKPREGWTVWGNEVDA